MALTDGDGGNIPATMLVSPSGNNGMNNFGGQDGWWFILLIILFACGGWNNNNGGYGNQPIIVNDGNGGSVQRGFDQAAIMGGINGIQSGVSGLSTQICNSAGDVAAQLCNGFSGVNATVNGGFANAETAANARQMANMNQAFGMQTAITGGLTNLSSQFAECCCDNRLATCQTQNVIQSESAATRFADANNTRDIIASQTQGTQAILDKLCQLELDGVKAQVEAKNDRIAELTNQLSMATLNASQTAQTAQLLAGQNAEVDALYNRLKSCPVPSQPVYGSQPIFTCNGGGCGCGV